VAELEQLGEVLVLVLEQQPLVLELELGVQQVRVQQQVQELP
jgi:hypothetical protein